MNKDILILGKGFIGTKIYEKLDCSITSKHIYSYKDAENIYSEFAPKIIINCIGTTGKNNVDDCENDIDRTLTANAFIPVILGELAIRKNIKLIHISSGCIYHYDYKRQLPITEDEIPDYYGLFYSRTKIYSENALKNLSARSNILILRIRIPLDVQPHPRNILDKLLRFEKVIDIPNSLTYIPDFIKALKFLIERDAKGIYNVVNKGALRYPELLDVYKKYRSEFSYKVMSLEEFPFVRTNLILSVEKLEKEGFATRDIHECLDECIKQYISWGKKY
ncbi:MAG: hypothetical protein B1H08_05680 [Candidatus Omnitrophica bacterium 4484_171]|nr:MAG: hypothetical protein B1H08_05680 [Candidatus Omnitrophica bacterium 4484_171]